MFEARPAVRRILAASSLAACVTALPAPAQGSTGESATPALLDRAIEQARTRIARSVEVWEDHSQWSNPWRAETEHYEVRATQSYADALNIAQGLETMFGHFVRTLGVEPRLDGRLTIFVVPDVKTYNEIGTAMSNTLAAVHSSIYGSFYAVDNPERAVTAVYSDSATYLRMQITHGAVHQFLDRSFTGTAPTWVIEGLVSYFSAFWDYGWTLDEFERIRDAGNLVPLTALVADGIGAYQGNSHERFMELGMLFYYLLNFREDTRTTFDDDGNEIQGPFRDYLLALLRGEDFSQLPVHQTLRDLAQLQADLVAYEFPR